MFQNLVMLNHTATLLNAIENLNLNLLDVCLDDSKSYQDVSKEIFLGELKNIFYRIKQSGDTKLEIRKGHCTNKACSNFKCKGYSFLAKKSNERIDLIFEEKGDVTEDIYHCNGLKIDDKISDNSSLAIIEFPEDFKNDFVPTDNYISQSLRCNKLLNEIQFLMQKQACLMLDDCINLFEQHKIYVEETLANIEGFSFEIKFFDYFFFIDRLLKLFKFNDECIVAMEDYNLFAADDEVSFLSWLKSFEGCYNALDNTEFNFLKNLPDEFDKIYFDKDLIIHCVELKEVFQFYKAFDKNLVLSKIIESFSKEHEHNFGKW